MATAATDSLTIRTSFVQENSPQRPHQHDLQPLVGRSLHQICVWGVDCHVTVMWLRLDMAVRSSFASALAAGIAKIERVAQPNGSTRYDVFVSPPMAPFLRRRMRKFALRWQWHFRDHRAHPLRDRVPAPRLGTPTETAPALANGTAQVPVGKAFRPGTLNINGVRSKQTDLWHLLRSERLDVLALQETLLKATDWDLHVPDYLCLSALGTTAASQRGVSLLVSTQFGCQSVGPGSPHWVFGKLTGSTLANPLIVGSVYLPHNDLQQRVRTQLSTALLKIHTEYPACAILLMGDLNETLVGAQRLARTWPGTFEILSNAGDVPTVRRDGGRTVDHMCLFANGLLPPGERMLPPDVLADWDISDHYPVVGSLPALLHQAVPLAPPTPARRRQTRIQCPTEAQKHAVIDSNRWEALADDAAAADAELAGDEQLASINRQSKDLLACCHSVATDLDLHQVPPREGPSCVPKSLGKVINHRRKAFRRLRRAKEDPLAHDVEIEALHVSHGIAAKQASQATKLFRRKLWHKRVRKAHCALLHNPRQFWRWASLTARWNLKASAAGIQPVRGQDGELKTTLPEQLEVWRTHFGNLATDITGNSQDPSRWQAIAEDTSLPALPNLDDDFRMEDVWKALQGMKTHRAPGFDGIPTDFYRSALKEKQRHDEWIREQAQQGATGGGIGGGGTAGMNLASDSDDSFASRESDGGADNGGAEASAGGAEDGGAGEARDQEPSLFMTTALLNLLNCAWTTGTIGDDWVESIVVSLPKKGDLTDPGNYRGISLMSTCLKIACVILSRRINEAAEAARRFSPSQAGFRRLEECITHAACLVEAIQRRRLAGLPTFGLFIDLKKAYDMVPHEAVFAKMRRFGIRGRCYDFIVALYKRSTIRVRLGHGSGAAYTEPFDLERGVRQGCPLSCILFNIFINDLFDDIPYPTVEIPRGTRTKPVLPTMGLAGLLFADDALGLASTREETCMLCDHITRWTETNEMKVGIGKCGIMEWGSDGVGGYSDESSLPDPDFDARLVIGGEAVPIVQEYLYLGVTITRTLAVADLLAPRLESGRKTVYSLAPFLRCPVIPLSDRMKVIQGVVLPRLLYGAELYGMCRSLTDAMQRLLNTALRSMLRVGPWRSLSSYALWKEFGMKPVCALAAGRRVRAFLKCFELSTWVHELVAEPYRTKKWTWVTGVSRWTMQQCPKHSNLSRAEWLQWQTWTPSLAKAHVESAITQREYTLRLTGHRKRIETDWYSDGEYGLTPLHRPSVAYSPVSNPGIALLIRARMGAIATVEVLLSMEKLPMGWNGRCPCCGAAVTEDIPHILLECSRYEPQRDKFLSAMLSQLAEVDPDDTFDRRQKSFMLLGGSVEDSCLPAWLPPSTKKDDLSVDELSIGSADLSASSSDRSSILDVAERPTLETLLTPETGCLQVASFLLLVVRARNSYLRTVPDWPVGQDGQAFSAPGQRPNG